MDGIGTSDDAFWCWEEDAKGLGSIVGCRPRNKGVSLRPRGVVMVMMSLQGWLFWDFQGGIN
jgi:hypothetical protein